MAKDRFDDDYDIDTGEGRRTKHQSQGRSAFEVPPGINFFKPKKSGTHDLDVVPFRVTENHNRFHSDLRYSSPGKWYPERTFWVHYDVGINKATYCCSAKTFGKPCPVCDERSRLGLSPHPEDKVKLAAIGEPKERQLILIHDTEAPDKGLQLWEVSYHLFFKPLENWIRGVPEKSRPMYEAYFHPIRGMTIHVNCTEKPAGPKVKPFTEWLTHSMFARAEPLPEPVRNHGLDLDALPILMPYSKLKAILLGLDDGDDAPGDDDETADRPAQPRPSRQGDAGRNGASQDEQPARTAQAAPQRRETAPPPRQPEPEPAADPVVYSVDDAVQFDWRGEMVQGVVEKVNLESGWADVRIADREKPIRLDFSELQPAEEGDDTFPLPTDDAPEPAPKPAAKTTTAARTAQTKPPTTKPAGGWDDPDDNAPFAPSPPPPPAPKKGGGKR